MDTSKEIIMTTDEMLEHWQGHRRLTRRIIEAFPDDKLFTFNIGGMRTFGEICHELLMMAAPAAKGIATGEWGQFGDIQGSPLKELPKTKEEVLLMWDWSTPIINDFWATIKPGRFQEEETAYGMYEGKIWWHLGYIMDNEIHHRGQGYVYLRALGVEPPAFWEREE